LKGTPQVKVRTTLAMLVLALTASLAMVAPAQADWASDFCG
tara:strand:+ start:2848 stop:2970 length:123 start_codon:yes stop_codon:yes gene_type:complete